MKKCSISVIIVINYRICGIFDEKMNILIMNIQYYYVRNFCGRYNTRSIWQIFLLERITFSSRDRLVVRTLRCGRSNPGSNPGHGNVQNIVTVKDFFFAFFVTFLDLTLSENRKFEKKLFFLPLHSLIIKKVQ